MMNKIGSVLLAILFASMLLVACGQNDDNSTQGKEQAHTESNQERLLQAHPLPELIYSLELENLSERLERFNDPNKVSYIYLMSEMGSIIAFLPIQGKVSSVNSLMSTGEQVVWRRGCTGDGCTQGFVVESPQLDGSYGENGDAIFFFTTENVYVEWNGPYLLVDQPLAFESAPVFLYDVTEEETQSSGIE